MRRKTQTYQRSLSEFARRFRHRPAECATYSNQLGPWISPVKNLEKVSWNLEKLPKIWKKIKKSQITGWVRSCSSWYFEASGAISHTLPAKCCADLSENHLPDTFLQPFQLDRFSLKKWVGPGYSWKLVSFTFLHLLHSYTSMMPRETHNMPIFELMPVEIAANQTKWTWTVWTTAVILVYLTSHLSLSIILGPVSPTPSRSFVCHWKLAQRKKTLNIMSKRKNTDETWRMSECPILGPLRWTAIGCQNQPEKSPTTSPTSPHPAAPWMSLEVAGCWCRSLRWLRRQGRERSGNALESDPTSYPMGIASLDCHGSRRRQMRRREHHGDWPWLRQAVSCQNEAWNFWSPRYGNRSTT